MYIWDCEARRRFSGHGAMPDGSRPQRPMSKPPVEATPVVLTRKSEFEPGSTEVAMKSRRSTSDNGAGEAKNA